MANQDAGTDDESAQRHAKPPNAKLSRAFATDPDPSGSGLLPTMVWQVRSWGRKKADPLHMANTERVGQTPARSWSGCLNPYRSRWASQELPRWASRQAGVRATARGESQVQNVGKKRSQPWRLRQPGRFHTRTVFVARSSTGLAAKNCEKIGPYFHVWLWGAIVSWLSHTLSVSVLSLSATFCSSAWADSGRVPKPCRQPDLTVEVYALGGAIRPNLSLAVFDSPARTSTGGTPEQDFTARGGDLGFVNPWMPTVEGGAIVFPCRFFGLGVHGGGSWSGVPDGTATSPQLAQRTGGQISMMRMSVSVHGQLPLSRYFLLRATVLVGYRNYALSVSGMANARPSSSRCRSNHASRPGCVCLWLCPSAWPHLQAERSCPNPLSPSEPDSFWQPIGPSLCAAKKSPPRHFRRPSLPHPQPACRYCPLLPMEVPLQPRPLSCNRQINPQNRFRLFQWKATHRCPVCSR